jgi:hypothetical protein
LRRAVVDSARELARLAVHHAARGVKTEHPAELDALGRTVAGDVDLSWESPPVVLDLKWGKSPYEKRIESGTAVQLAAYAAMQSDPARTEVAYFTLKTQELLASPGGRLAAIARLCGPHDAAAIWSATLASAQARQEALAAGRMEAPGADGSSVEPALAPSGLTISTKLACKYCAYGELCGRERAR